MLIIDYMLKDKKIRYRKFKIDMIVVYNLVKPNLRARYKLAIISISNKVEN